MSEATPLSDVGRTLDGLCRRYWRAGDFDGRRASAGGFVDQLKPICTSPLKGHRRDGVRTAERIAARLNAREQACLRRSAQDLAQLDEIDARRRRRAAETARRRWFVLGRLLSEAAGEDPHWAGIVEALIGRAALTLQEARALGRQR